MKTSFILQCPHSTESYNPIVMRHFKPEKKVTSKKSKFNIISGAKYLNVTKTDKWLFMSSSIHGTV